MTARLCTSSATHTIRTSLPSCCCLDSVPIVLVSIVARRFSLATGSSSYLGCLVLNSYAARVWFRGLLCKALLLTGTNMSEADAESLAPTILSGLSSPVPSASERPTYAKLGYLHAGLLLRVFCTSAVTSYRPMDSCGGFGAQIGLNSQQSLLRRVLN